MVSLGPFLVSRALRVARRLASDCLCIYLCIDMRDGWNFEGRGREKSKSVECLVIGLVERLLEYAQTMD